MPLPLTVRELISMLEELDGDLIVKFDIGRFNNAAVVANFGYRLKFSFYGVECINHKTINLCFVLGI